MRSSIPDTDDVVGAVIDGRYRVQRFLGSGAMGAVYEATQLAVGRRVAVKLLNASLKGHGDIRERFRLEAQAIAALNHPNCITLFDFGYAEELGALYMVVEYVEGRTLQDLLADGIELDFALHAARQIADVCAHAHDAGILHRDLKPENVMVVEDDGGEPVVKVLDFGLARIFDAADDTRLTRQGQLFGSPAYMSPEQCGGSLDATSAVDVYALGVSMFEMLTGRLPYESQNVAEILVMHVKSPIPRLAAPDVPPAVADLVGRMMGKEPEDRPDAREVCSVLDGVLQSKDGPPSDARRPATAEATARLTRGDTRDSLFLDGVTGTRQKLVITAILFCCIGVVGAVALLVTVDQGRGPLAKASAIPEAPRKVWEPVRRIDPRPSPDQPSSAPASDEARAAAMATRSRAQTIALTVDAAATGEDESVPPRPTGGVQAKPDRPAPTKRPEKKSRRQTNEDTKTFRKLEFSY